MSNEYKDWATEKSAEEKAIVEKYPFLHIRDIDGTLDIHTRFPLVGLEIPDGWYKVFFQMCDDIMPLLEEEGVMDKFYFIQVKEKYNNLVCYSNGAASQRVEDIISKYEEMAYYICTQCGKPATCMTTGYWASLCDDCWKDNLRYIEVKQIDFLPEYNVTEFSNGKRVEKTISFEDEWNRYLKGLCDY